MSKVRNKKSEPKKINEELLSLHDQARRSAEEHPDQLNAISLVVVLALYKAFMQIDRSLDKEASAWKLDTRQAHILTLLHRINQPTTMRALSKMMAVRPSNLTGVVEALVKRGFVERTINPNDHRSVLVSLSSAGRDILMDYLPTHWATVEKHMHGLGLGDRQHLAALLERLISSGEGGVQ